MGDAKNKVQKTWDKSGKSCAFSVKDFRAGARGLEEYRKQRESWLRYNVAIRRLLNLSEHLFLHL